MIKRLIVSVLILTLSAALFSCAEKDEGPDAEEVADTIVAACDELSLEIGPAAQEAIKDYVEDKEAKAEKKRKKQKEKEEEEKREAEEGDADDPANADTTADTGKNATVDEMTARYVGRWEQQGIILSDGNLDTTSGSHCTYVINADKTYTAKGIDIGGAKINEKGKWKLNSKKQLVCGKYTLGIDESGYLLKDTGERDGKGRKIKYAFAKV